MGTANNMHRQYLFDITVHSYTQSYQLVTVTYDLRLAVVESHICSIIYIVQDTVNPGQNIIGIDFEVGKQQFPFVSILT